MKVTLTPEQVAIILDAVEDYAVLVNEDLADDCGEILDILEAAQTNNETQVDTSPTGFPVLYHRELPGSGISCILEAWKTTQPT